MENTYYGTQQRGMCDLSNLITCNPLDSGNHSRANICTRQHIISFVRSTRWYYLSKNNSVVFYLSKRKSRPTTKKFTYVNYFSPGGCKVGMRPSCTFCKRVHKTCTRLLNVYTMARLALRECRPVTNLLVLITTSPTITAYCSILTRISLTLHVTARAHN